MVENCLGSCIEFPDNENEIRELMQDAKDWALLHGIGSRSKFDFTPDGIVFSPFTLFPSTFPREQFEKAVNLQCTFNLLVHKIAHDREFLTNALKNTIKVDGFTKKLFDIYETVWDEGLAQPVSLGLLRSDYMLDGTAHSNNTIKQVEINTIAISLAGMASQLVHQHRFILQRLGYPEKSSSLPNNNALTGLSEGLVGAWKLYNSPQAVILFVVEEVTYAVCDQRLHEYEIYRLEPGIKVIRRTLTEIAADGYLHPGRKLFVNDMEVAVVYMRAGYSPEHYYSFIEYDCRLMMERSAAIKCPSIHYQLAGTKKVQQIIATENMLERFLTKQDPKIQDIKSVFTEIYSLDTDEESKKAIEILTSDPLEFVMKPQREGGGNNVYGKDVYPLLSKFISTDERLGWILMKRIRPPIQHNYILKPLQQEPPSLMSIISELGIYGVILGSDREICINKEVGYLLRSKGSITDEGGLAAGAGCLDSPFLT